MDHVVLCRETGGVFAEISRMRSIKDEYEITATGAACALSDTITGLLEKHIGSGKIKTEIDAALFIERTIREAGGDGIGFETLAAGSSRSYAIHPVPAYTHAKIGTDGLSIIDFGVMIDGYTSDTTLTIATGKLDPAQEKLITLVEKRTRQHLPCTSRSSDAGSGACGRVFKKRKACRTRWVTVWALNLMKVREYATARTMSDIRKGHGGYA